MELIGLLMLAIIIAVIVWPKIEDAQFKKYREEEKKREADVDRRVREELKKRGIDE